MSSACLHSLQYRMSSLFPS
ncbi:hypothetical protein E2C01_094286 [Portunus trituberculatus]|uniref:Uncharacterized protein n=1 Tax=Portunus trituberculatus TaxID=210409 RepID=A0A5B7JQ12_PORTR|nr:hypothetical protein [Portunus trituberculatus]